MQTIHPAQRNAVRSISVLGVAAILFATAAEADTLYATSPTITSSRALNSVAFSNGLLVQTGSQTTEISNVNFKLIDTAQHAGIDNYSLVLYDYPQSAGTLTELYSKSFSSEVTGNTAATANVISANVDNWVLQPDSRYIVTVLGESGLSLLVGNQNLSGVTSSYGWLSRGAVQMTFVGPVGNPGADFLFGDTYYKVSPFPRVGPNHSSVPFMQIEGQAVSAVPEPETYAMLLAGLAVLGAMNRRRRSQVLPACSIP